MKSKVEIDPKLPEEWAEFHVHELTPKLQQVIQLLEHDEQIWGYVDQIVKPLALAQIISLNSQAGKLYAMTEHGSYQVKKKLYEVAKKNCEDTILIESVEELCLEDFEKDFYKDKIGIMAGASTPKKSIDEVITFLKEGRK